MRTTISVNYRRALHRTVWNIAMQYIGFLGLLLVLALSQASSAQSLETLGTGVYNDADLSSINPKTGNQEFKGNVVLIGAGTLISADQVSSDLASRKVTARGHVVLMSGGQVFTGETVTYHTGSGDFELTNAVMVANDPDAVKEVKEKVLGFTEAEANFERIRKSSLRKLNEEKKSIRNDARMQFSERGKVEEELVESYAVLLEREGLVKSQENPGLAKLDPSRRQRLKARRAYWESSRKSPVAPAKSNLSYFFRLEGETIERINDNDFYARNTVWTPCKCEEDETPAWGFRAERAFAQIGGYADLYHPVLEIKGIPVLYLPYLKVPIKGERQSGFLMPSFGFEKRSGNIISQPVYFNFAEHADATLYTDYFEKRGTRLGLEYRYQHREYSGWNLRIEGLRDNLWMEERGVRDDLQGLYSTGLSSAIERIKNNGNDAYSELVEDSVPTPGISDRVRTLRILKDPDYWDQLDNGKFDKSFGLASEEAVRKRIDQNMAVPSNSWRGAYRWQGLTFFAPRLSFVSKGEIQTDHRYSEDLDFIDNYDQSYSGNSRANAFSAVRARIHLDAEEYYLGLGTGFGDNQLTDSQYEGQQTPVEIRWQSRYYTLFPRSPVPLYLQLRVDQNRISEIKPEKDEVGTTGVSSLGDGQWRRFKASTLSPLVTDQVVQVNHFSELEARYIEHAGLSEPRSEIRSWRTGVGFVLPIDGVGELPGWLSGEDEGTSNTIHHFMDWGMKLSIRPSAVRRGPYTNPGFGSQGVFAYYASDSLKNRTSIDDGVENYDRMKTHQLVTFSTNHFWQIYRDEWTAVESSDGLRKAKEESSEGSAEDRARQELMYSLDRPVSGQDAMFDEKSDRLLVTRYVKTKQDLRTPVVFNASIDYDFLSARRREEQREENRSLDPQIEAAKAAVAAKNAEIEAAEKGSEKDQLKTELKPLQQNLSELQSQYNEDLDEPWTGPRAYLRIQHAGWRLSEAVRYNIYTRASEDVDFSLSPPRLFSIGLTAGYRVQKELDEDLSFNVTRTRSLLMNTSSLGGWSLGSEVKLRLPDDRETIDTSHKEIFYSKYDLAYVSPSDCWGLRFSRLKDYGNEEREAEYLLQFSIVFLGQPRNLAPMQQGLEREIRNRSSTESGT